MIIWPSEEIKKLYEKLIIWHVGMQIPGKASVEPTCLSEHELSLLINFASLFALTDDHEKKTVAYEIITRVVEISDTNKSAFATAAEFILARLGNFPGRQLLRQRRRSFSETQYKLPLYLRLEEKVKESQNAVMISEGQIRYLTDFQYDFLSLLAESNTASVSAPTSAGKSFVFSLDVIRRLKEEKPVSIVYTVPTRALIREVMRTIIDAIRSAGLKNIPVRCVPIPVDRQKISLGAIYVFTPERLMSFLQTDQGESLGLRTCSLTKLKQYVRVRAELFCSVPLTIH
jgi:hypothetical protein